MQWIFKIFIMNLILGLFTFANSRESYQFKKFRVAPVAAIQSNGISYSTVISWNPEYQLENNWKMGFNLGLSAFETKARNDYVILEYQVTGARLINCIYGIELGLGQQYWFIDGGNAAMDYSGTFFYYTEKNKYYVENLFIGLNYLDLPGLATREIRLGVGFSY